MDFNNRHPLNQITSSNSLSMLELLIPFVDYPLKLPLALFIKLNEILLIMNTFQSIDTLSRYGLNSTARNPTDILCAITGISPDLLNIILSSSNNTQFPFSPELFSNFQTSNTENTTDYSNLFQAFHNPTGQNSNSNNNNDSFDESIANIFAEYDKIQNNTLNSQENSTFDMQQYE